MAGDDDAALVRRSLEGDAGAFGALVDRYRRPVFTLALRMLKNRAGAEDVAQDAFVKAHGRLDRYDPGRSFGTWILTIASRLCLDVLRRGRWHGGSLDDEDAPDTGGPADPEPGPEARAIAGDLSGRVREAVDRLPERQRAAVVMRHLMDMSYKEVAEALDVPVGTAKTLAYQGRRALEEMLPGADEE
jgi:RNA polymerase sigma-70 factor (ECF subfamily)